jgi:hypothetical protein
MIEVMSYIKTYYISVCQITKPNLFNLFISPKTTSNTGNSSVLSELPQRAAYEQQTFNILALYKAKYI